MLRGMNAAAKTARTGYVRQQHYRTSESLEPRARQPRGAAAAQRAAFAAVAERRPVGAVLAASHPIHPFGLPQESLADAPSG